MLLYGGSEATRRVLDRFLAALGAADYTALSALFAPDLDWRLSWPDDELGGAVPWIRRRNNPEDVEQHFQMLATHNAPDGIGTTVDRVVVAGLDAVVFGMIRNTLRSTGVAYQAAFALHLTVEREKITRYHIYEDSLAVARAWNVGSR